MTKRNKKAFTLSEAIIVLILIGIIAILYSAAIKLYNPTQRGFDVKAEKTLENIDQVFNLIFAKHSESFNLTDLHDSTGNFSITDNDATKRFAQLFKEYVNIIDFDAQNDDKYKDYYSGEIIDFDNTSTGLKLNQTYSEFMNSINGMVYGFKLYKSCSASETNAAPPFSKGRGRVDDICGSIFYDVNGYAEPNKLGSDQYIIPFDALGSKIKK